MLQIDASHTVDAKYAIQRIIVFEYNHILAFSKGKYLKLKFLGTVILYAIISPNMMKREVYLNSQGHCLKSFWILYIFSPFELSFQLKLP